MRYQSWNWRFESENHVYSAIVVGTEGGIPINAVLLSYDSGNVPPIKVSKQQSVLPDSNLNYFYITVDGSELPIADCFYLVVNNQLGTSQRIDFGTDANRNEILKIFHYQEGKKPNRAEVAKFWKTFVAPKLLKIK